MLSKRQLSPDGYHTSARDQPMKRHHKSRAYQGDRYHKRRRTDADMDEFLYEDEDYPPARRQWRDRGRGGYLGARGWDFILPGRRRGENSTARTATPPTDTVTPMPTRNQHLAAEDKHDSMLDSYDQRRFGGIIPDKCLLPEERIADLSVDLPAMLLNNGSYPRLARVNRSIADLIDGIGSSDEDSGDDKPLTSVQKARLFIERRNRRLCHPGRLPLWLNRFTPEGTLTVPSE